MPLAPEHLACSRCHTPIPPADWNREHAFCASCRAPLQALIFPAFFPKPAAASRGTPVLEAGESSCFYHPLKRAVVPCDRCGRFLCALCQVEFLGQNWCPRCIQASSEKGQLAQLDPSRKLYDNLALILATFPALIVWPTIITAPVTWYVVVRYWHAPSSILPRTKIRFYIAALLATLEIGAWIWLVLFLIYRRR
ncbi:MAG TPA: hypothetical protein VGP62_05560 [Bryobacteraceae bacterium]|jgi:hypothetical protein|nr:hypothetical protein [Bryobacteraceae bacterium]